MKWNCLDSKHFFIVRLSDTDSYLTQEIDEFGPIRYWLRKYLAEVFPKKRLNELDKIVNRTYNPYEIVWVDSRDVIIYHVNNETQYRLNIKK